MLNEKIGLHTASCLTVTKCCQKSIGFQSVSASHPAAQYLPVQNLIASVSDDSFCIMISRDQLVGKRLQDSDFLFLLKTEAIIRTAVP